MDMEKIFKIDESSPSRLAWNIDIYSGKYKTNAQNSKARKSGELSGVNYYKSNTGYEYWRTRWSYQGKNYERLFSIVKLGFNEAKRQATELRFI